MEVDEKSIKFLPLKHLSFQNHWVAKRLGAEAPSPLVALYLRFHSGVAPGEGYWDIVFRWSMLAPRRKVKSDFFKDFWQL